MNVTVWNEFVHEKEDPIVKEIYPDGIHTAIADFLKENTKYDINTATLDMKDQGLSEETLNNTDVLIWWGHCAHGKVEDSLVERIALRVHAGMGIIILHSGHFSKIMKKLMGTSCTLNWRAVGEKEIIWNMNPSHPIAKGISEKIILEHEEMYGEPFGVRKPDETVFISWFEGGEVFRSGNCYNIERGKLFYFQPGHETYPIYHDVNIQKIITNAVNWAMPTNGIIDTSNCHQIKEPIMEIK